MAPYKNIYIEISGICNGKCPYCMNGRYKDNKGAFISPGLFDQILHKLFDLGLVNSRTEFGLYNWGEPFLHPHLSEIIQIANQHNISYSFSTNASTIPKINHQFIHGLKRIIFSMPGYSQNSYDRIHGFNFEEIRNNIEVIIQNSRAAGFQGALEVSYHVYQFNLDEITSCETFAHKNGIDFIPQYAILNNWEHLWAYIDNNLPYEKIKEISQDLFCYKLRDIRPEKVEDYRCPQYNLLTIDEYANVLLCCQVPRNQKYITGNLLHDDLSTILQRRQSNDVCSKCIERGLARYINNSLDCPELWKHNLIKFPSMKQKVNQIMRSLR